MILYQQDLQMKKKCFPVSKHVRQLMMLICFKGLGVCREIPSLLLQISYAFHGVALLIQLLHASDVFKCAVIDVKTII